MKRFTERVYQDSIERVDVENGVLYGVKVLGQDSRNKRRYVAKAMKEAAPKYEGVNSYVDHPDRSNISEDRKFGSLSGVLRNPRYIEGKGIFADLHLLKEGTYFKGIIEAAQKFPKSVGFSHVAEGESHLDGETEIIESIREVFSVDLVTSPATTRGFFESTESELLEEFKSLRESVESLPEHPIRKKLSEMMDAYLDGGFNNAKEDQPTDPLSQLTAVLRETIAALADSLKALAKANKPAPAPVAPNAAPALDPEAGEETSEEEDEEMSPEDKEKLAAFEGVQRELAEQRAKNLLLESRREATSPRIAALAKCADEAEQKELLESWPCIEEATRPTRSPALAESTRDEFDFSQPGSFAARYR